MIQAIGLQINSDGKRVKKRDAVRLYLRKDGFESLAVTSARGGKVSILCLNDSLLWSGRKRMIKWISVARWEYHRDSVPKIMYDQAGIR